MGKFSHPLQIEKRRSRNKEGIGREVKSTSIYPMFDRHHQRAPSYPHISPIHEDQRYNRQS